MNMLKYISGLLIPLLFVAGCTTLPTQAEQQALYEDTLKAKFEKLKQDKKKDCYLTAVQDAENDVDSLIYQLVNLELLDSIEMIDRPYRPERPDFIRGIDTSKVKPLFEVERD